MGGPITSPCSPDVEIEFLAAARGDKGAKGDFAMCAAGGPDYIAQGAETVIINGMYATRANDKTEHNGVIVGCASDVEIGGPTITFRTIKQRGPGAVATEDSKSKGKHGDKDDSKDQKPGSQQPATPGESPVGEGSNGGVFARFRLVSPLSPKLGDELVFECTSWDPDTGGSAEAPNPGSIVQRTWGIGGPGLRGTGTDTGSTPRWVITPSEATQSTGSDSPECSPPRKVLIAHVILQVTDKQGQTAITSLDIELRVEKKPKAVITRLPKGADRITSQDTPRTTVYLRCDSYEDDRSTSRVPTPGRILTRTWTARTPNGTPLYVTPNTDDLRFVSINPIFYDSGGPGVPLQISSKAYVTLKVVTAFGEDTSDQIEVSAAYHPEARIVASRVIASDMNAWQHNLAKQLGRKELLVEGDGLVVDAEVSSDIEIEDIRWQVVVGRRASSHTTRIPRLVLPVVDAGGLGGRGGVPIVVTIESVNGFRGDEYPTQARLERCVNPSATWENIREKVARDLLELAVSAGITVAVGAVTGGVGSIGSIGLLAGGSVAGTVLQQGFQDLGVPKWAAVVLTMSVSQGGDVLRLAVDQRAAADFLREEILRTVRRKGVSVLEAQNSGLWREIVISHFDDQLGTIANAQAREAVKSALETAIQEARTEYIGTVN